MKCRSMVGTLFLFMMLAAVSRPAQAVETTFDAGVTTNPETEPRLTSARSSALR